MSIAEPLIQVSLLGEALDHGPVAVFVFGEDMRNVAVNAHACALLGYDRDELLRLRMTDLFVDAPDVIAHEIRCRASLLRSDGTEVEVEYVACATTMAGMGVYVAVGWAT